MYHGVDISIVWFSYSGVFIVHYDAHQPVIDDLEARILTIRDSL